MIERRPRINKPQKMEENYFDTSVNQKGSSNISGFDSGSRQKSQSKQEKSLSKDREEKNKIPAEGFETFENREIIKQNMDKLKK